MASRSAWTPGNGAGSTWTTAINSSDMASLPGTTAGTNTVLSTVADIANFTNLDQFIQISFSLTIAASAIVAGSNIAFWLFYLNQDGTTYGDGNFTAGTQKSATPTFTPCFAFPLPVVASVTTLVGNSMGMGPIVINPGSFRLAIQNNSGFALTSGAQTVKIQTFNMNLNS